MTTFDAAFVIKCALLVAFFLPLYPISFIIENVHLIYATPHLFFLFFFYLGVLTTTVTSQEADSVDAVVAEPPVALPATDIFTTEQREQLQASEESHQFQTEVSRLMDILINSLYTSRDIFLRETISNAADALDKLRFLSLTQPEILEAAPELKIKISFDKANRLLTIQDTGIGMTKDELIQHLGVVAKSGTTDFLQAAQSGKDALSLIGQFGVGFYSVYLVADKVTVTSKSYKDDNQYVWESTAQSKFTVARDPRGNTLGRGTEIVLHIKPDAVDEFLNEKRLSALVDKYSQFVNFPIYIATPKTVTEEVEIVDDDDVVVAGDENNNNNNDLKVVDDDDDDAENKPKTKKVTKEVIEDVQVNTVKPLWVRSASELTNDDYEEFYKQFAKDRNGFVAKNHFSAEGDVDFKALLFIPNTAQHGAYERYYDHNSPIKMFVRRVMISEEVKDLLPRYLHFVKGLVDSDDLPLNVNREMLSSQSRVLNVIGKKLTRKVLEMLKNLANTEQEQIDAYNDAKLQEEQNPDEVVDVVEPEYLYLQFWREFGSKFLKLGILDDRANLSTLGRLLRFKTTKTNPSDKNDYVSLDTYLERKVDEQKAIYYLTGESLAALDTSPFLARAKALGVEVLLLDDPLDEYLVQSFTEYDGHPLQSLAREGVELPGAAKPNLLQQQLAEFKPLLDFLNVVYNSDEQGKLLSAAAKVVDKVTLVHRLDNFPIAVVSPQYGTSAGMERIMKAQALQSGARQGPASKKIVELNPFHPIVQTLADLVKQADANDNEARQKATNIAQVLFDSALISSGYQIADQKAFANRLVQMVGTSLQLTDLDAQPEPAEDLPDPVVEQAAAADAEVDIDVAAAADAAAIKDEL